MSWLTSLFTNRPNTPAAPLHSNEKRLLEVEPATTAENVPTSVKQSQPIGQPAPELVNRNRNKVIFAAGVTFFAFSLLITRRSFARKRLSMKPNFYTNTPEHHAQEASRVSGAMEGVEALNIATINVLSLAMMGTGGALWYLDINSMKDAQRLLRGGLGVDGTGRDEQSAEEEFEEWMASVLARRDAKERNRDEVSASRRTNDRRQER